MSKSPNILLPALGGAGIACGVAVAAMYHSSGEAKVALMQDRMEQVQEHAATAQKAAETETARAAELEAKVLEVQAAATVRVASGITLTAPAPAFGGAFGLGRPALPEELAAWDVDVLPDGRGLPQGSGNAYDGEDIFADRCGACHGDFAEGVDNWPVLAGGFDTLADADPVKTVGSYWPHLSTVYDYVYRSMPFGEAGTLTPDETYAIVAYILYSNDLIEDDFELTQENLGSFDMHNKAGFVVDDRAAREYAAWRGEPCMENCKEETSVTMRSVFLVDTPAAGGTESVMNPAKPDGLPSFTADGPSFIPATAPKAEEEANADPAVEEGDDAAQLVAAGKKVFKKCKACHEVGDGAKNKSGPQLNTLMGRTMGSIEGFKYSNVFKTAQDEGRRWDEPALAEFLEKPKAYMKGTKMSFPGLRKETDRAALIEYLKTFGG